MAASDAEGLWGISGVSALLIPFASRAGRRDTVCRSSTQHGIVSGPFSTVCVFSVETLAVAPASRACALRFPAIVVVRLPDQSRKGETKGKERRVFIVYYVASFHLLYALTLSLFCFFLRDTGSVTPVQSSSLSTAYSRLAGLILFSEYPSSTPTSMSCGIGTSRIPEAGGCADIMPYGDVISDCGRAPEIAEAIRRLLNNGSEIPEPTDRVVCHIHAIYAGCLPLVWGLVKAT